MEARCASGAVAQKRGSTAGRTGYPVGPWRSGFVIETTMVVVLTSL